MSGIAIRKSLSSVIFITAACVLCVAAPRQAFAQAPPAAPAPKPAAAPAPAPAAPAKAWTLTLGSDVTSAYMFRGIFQEDTGSIIQPAIDIGVAVGQGVSVNFGNWDSLHSSSATGKYYESDYYGSITGTAGKWKPGVLFTSYTSPGDHFAKVNELAFVLAYDDSGHATPVSPKLVIAQELSGQADGGANKGTYLEAGIKPAVKLGTSPVSLLIPIKLGMSLKDYYELPAADSKFGYFDLGFILSASKPLTKGTIEFHGGVDILTLGDNMKARNGGDKMKPVVSAGFTYVY